jgi:hypothetical protein
MSDVERAAVVAAGVCNGGQSQRAEMLTASAAKDGEFAVRGVEHVFERPVPVRAVPTRRESAIATVRVRAEWMSDHD